MIKYMVSVDVDIVNSEDIYYLMGEFSSPATFRVGDVLHVDEGEESEEIIEEICWHLYPQRKYDASIYLKDIFIDDISTLNHFAFFEWFSYDEDELQRFREAVHKAGGK